MLNYLSLIASCESAILSKWPTVKVVSVPVVHEVFSSFTQVAVQIQHCKKILHYQFKSCIQTPT